MSQKILSNFNNEKTEDLSTESQTSYTKYANGNILDDHDEDCAIKSEVALFRAVIMQALTDAVSKSKRTEDKMAKISAQSWFSENNKDFRLVCELANLNFRWVIKKAHAAIKNNCRWKRTSIPMNLVA